MRSDATKTKTTQLKPAKRSDRERSRGAGEETERERQKKSWKEKISNRKKWSQSSFIFLAHCCLGSPFTLNIMTCDILFHTFPAKCTSARTHIRICTLAAHIHNTIHINEPVFSFFFRLLLSTKEHHLYRHHRRRHRRLRRRLRRSATYGMCFMVVHVGSDSIAIYPGWLLWSMRGTSEPAFNINCVTPSPWTCGVCTYLPTVRPTYFRAHICVRSHWIEWRQRWCEYGNICRTSSNDKSDLLSIVLSQ